MEITNFVIGGVHEDDAICPKALGLVTLQFSYKSSASVGQDAAKFIVCVFEPIVIANFGGS